MFNMPINAIWLCFHDQRLKSALETQIKAYAEVANIQHAEKRYLAVFSSSLFKSALKTHIKSYSAFKNVQHAEKRYLVVFS